MERQPCPKCARLCAWTCGYQGSSYYWCHHCTSEFAMQHPKAWLGYEPTTLKMPEHQSEALRREADQDAFERDGHRRSY